MSPICHLLVGIPGSGKSTFAQKWVEADPSYAIVSTDRIREELFGDESIQGDWAILEARVFEEIDAYLAQGTPVIYDATNAKRPWRLGFVQKMRQTSSHSPRWMAWHLATPVEICQQRNRQRDRTVPDAVIQDMAAALNQFAPCTAEGFADVNVVPVDAEGNYKLSAVFGKIEGCDRSRISRANRSRQVEWHPYSLLLDFERLMFLLAQILRDPGLGSRQRQKFETSFETSVFETSVEEVAAKIAREYGAVYADVAAIARDLAWLESIGLVNTDAPRDAALTVETIDRPPDAEAHRYSDRDRFLRLMAIVRAILRSPLQEIPEENSLETLVAQLAADGIAGETRDTVRRDIELALKPYGVLRSSSYRRGYFLGTAIFTPSELNAAYKLLQSQARHFDDPIALETYQTFGDRLKQSKLLTADEGYPVRILGTRPIVSARDLPQSALTRHIPAVERAILFQRRYANETGELLELNRLQGGGRFAGDGDAFFRVWPLQLVFHNIAWYLGYECCGGDEDGLLRFERLDRLFLGQPTHQTRSRQQQRQALQRLTRLYDASAGAFLGNSAADQQAYLNHDRQESVEVRVELWCSDTSFRFISEGTQRFGKGQMQMSPKPEGRYSRGVAARSQPKSLFCLKATGDPQFPHRFRVCLPRWSLWDVDLRRWVLGWAAEVKVVEPPELVEWVREAGRAIVGVYQVSNK
ncbi:MAG: AAA family ATPase [Geitlerinemataceae cyanobacterium]